MKSKRLKQSSKNNRIKTRKNNILLNQSISINVLNKKMVSETNFGGYPLDLLFGILYLKQKHPLSLALPFDIKKLLETYSSDLRDRYPFTFIGCVFYKCHESIIQQELYSNNNSNKKEYIFNKKDFDIELPGKVSINEFKELLNDAKKRGRRFTILPLIIRWSCNYKFEGHSNLLIFDFEKNIVERFEPYGYISQFSEDEIIVSKAFNSDFKKILKKINPKFKYIDPSQSLKKGPQHFEESQLTRYSIIKNSKDPEGFCGAWSLWYADLRLSNPDKSPNELIIKALKSIKTSNTRFLRKFIRNYSLFLVKERYKFLKKIKQKNPYNYALGEQIQSLDNKKTTIANLLKTTRLINNKSIKN